VFKNLEAIFASTYSYLGRLSACLGNAVAELTPVATLLITIANTKRRLLNRLYQSFTLISAFASVSIIIALTHQHIVQPLERLEVIVRIVRETQNYSSSQSIVEALWASPGSPHGSEFAGQK